MEKSTFLNSAIVIIILLLHSTPDLCQSQSALKESVNLYNKGMVYLASGDTAKAESCFKSSIKTEDNEQSYYQLSSIYFDNGDYDLLSDAKDNIDEAIDLNSNNAEYWYLRGQILERFFNEGGVLEKFDRTRAISSYKEALKVNSDHLMANLRLGVLYKEDFVEYNKSVLNFHGPKEYYNSVYNLHANQSAYKQRQIFERETNTVDLSFVVYARKVFKSSKKYFEHVIHLDQSNYEARKEFSLLCLEADLPKEGYETLEAIKDSVKNSEIYEMLGVLYYKANEHEKAFAAFNTAFEYMNEEEKQDFQINSVKLILNDESVENIYNEDQLMKRIEFFWKKKDPLYITDYNERLLEHYYRVAYSDIMFSLEKQNIPGWKTDRGEMFVRYGFPVDYKRYRPNPVEDMTSSGSDEINNADGTPRLPDINQSEVHIPAKESKTEVWDYGEFTLAFADPYRSNNYKLSNNTDLLGSQYYEDSQEVFDNVLKKNKPEKYNPTFSGPTFFFNYKVYQFKKRGKTITDYYAAYELETNKNEDLSKYEVAMFLFDKHLNKLREKKTDWKPEADKGFVKRDTSKLYVNTMSIKPAIGGSNFALEMRRTNDKGVASRHDNIPLRMFNKDSLLLSDIVLAFDVVDNEEYPFTRDGISIFPNPNGTAYASDPFFIYYEAYNLKKQDGLTNFEQKIEIIPNEGTLEDIVNGIGDVLGIDNNGGQVTMVTEYQTRETEPQIYLRMNLEEYSAGEYDMIITVTDKNSNISTCSKTNFTILPN